MFVLAFVPTGKATCYTTSETQLDVETGAGRLYVDIDACSQLDACGPPTVWIYEESNGIEGLQRDDDWRSDIFSSGGSVAPDTLIF